MPARDDISANDIEQALRGRVDSLVPVLLPAAVRLPKYWAIANTRGEPGQQMQINRSGLIGLWTDFSETPKTDHGSGDMLKLIAAVRFGGWSAPGAKAKAIAWARSWLGWDSLDPGRIESARRESRAAGERAGRAAERETRRKRGAAAHLWHEAPPIAGTAAERYLEGRGIGPAQLGKYPGALRFRPDVWCDVRGGKFPAMLARIGALDGEMLGVHRTYLDVSAGKNGPVRVVKVIVDRELRVLRIARPGEAGAKSHKSSLGPYAGGHIPLWKGASAATLREIPRGTPSYVSEGIEDGLTIALAFPDRRVVAGVALANMGGLALPAQAGPAIFIGQRDPIGGKALEAFERAVARQQEQAAAQGRPMPEIIWPGEGFKDFNDQLLGKRMAEAAA